jgi:hypothetical protein
MTNSVINQAKSNGFKGGQQPPAQQSQRPNPPKGNLPAPVKVEKGHALANLKTEMTGRQDFYDQITEMRIQHIDHCETKSDAAVLAHIAAKGESNFFDSTELHSLMGQFMPANDAARPVLAEVA